MIELPNDFYILNKNSNAVVNFRLLYRVWIFKWINSYKIIKDSYF